MTGKRKQRINLRTGTAGEPLCMVHAPKGVKSDDNDEKHDH